MSVSSVGSTASVGFRGSAEPRTSPGRNSEGSSKTSQSYSVRLANSRINCGSRRRFQRGVKESDKIDDELRNMNWLFSDLRAMAEDLVSIPDEPDDKIWYKA